MVRTSLKEFRESIKEKAIEVYPIRDFTTPALAWVFQEAYVLGAIHGTKVYEAVTSDEEFDALPLGAIVLDRRNVIHRKSVDGETFVGRPADEGEIIVYPAKVIFS